MSNSYYGPRIGHHSPEDFNFREGDGGDWCNEHDIPYIGDCPVCASEEDQCDGDDGGRDTKGDAK